MRAALSCFRGFISSLRKTGKPDELHSTWSGTADGGAGLAWTGVPLVDASNLSAEWAGSQFPVACVAIGGLASGSSTAARRVTVLWHNAASLDIWDRLTSPATNPALAETILAMLSSPISAHQVVLVSGSTFAVSQPAVAAARFTSELLAAVSVPVHISPVQFSAGSLGVVAPQALLLVCRAPLMPPRHIDSRAPLPHQYGGMDPMAAAAANFGAAGGAPRRSPSTHTVEVEGEVEGIHSGSGFVAAHRQRDSMVAAHLPASITVFTLEGHVLHQNPASAQYMGAMPTTSARRHHATLLGSGPATASASLGPRGDDAAAGGGGGAGGLLDSPGGDGSDWASPSLGVLGLIFKYEQAKLGQMMEVLLGRGNIWQGIVRVPTSDALQQNLVYGQSARPQPPQQQLLRPGSPEPNGGGPVDALVRGDDSLRRGSQPPFLRHLQPEGSLHTNHNHHQHHHHHHNHHHHHQHHHQPPPPPQQQQQRQGLRMEGGPQSPLTAPRSQQQKQQAKELQGGPLPPPRGHYGLQEREQQAGEEAPEYGRPTPDGQQPPQQRLASALLDDGTTGSQQHHHQQHHHHLTISSSSYTASASASRQITSTSNGQQPHPQQLQRQPRPGSGAATGDVLMTESLEVAVAAAAVATTTTTMTSTMTGAAHPHDLSLGRGGAAAARSSVANLYDADADPLATSTWTVLADPTSRGWPTSHLSSQRAQTGSAPPHVTSAIFMATAGGMPRSLGAPRAARRSRQSTPLGSPDCNGKEAAATAAAAAGGGGGGGGGGASTEAAAAAAAALGLTRRWGSMTSAAAARGPTANVPPGPVSGPQVALGSAVHQQRQDQHLHHSSPYTGAGLLPPGASGGAEADGSTAPLEAAARLSSPPPWRQERSHGSGDVGAGGGGGGGGDGEVLNHDSWAHAVSRRLDGSAVPIGIHNHQNPVVSASGQTTSATTGAAASGISRVLVFANSLRSAPFAPVSAAAAAAAAATAAASVTPAPQRLSPPPPRLQQHGAGGTQVYDGGGSAAGGGGGGGVSMKRARSSSAIRRHSSSYGKTLTATATVPPPDPPTPVRRRDAAAEPLPPPSAEPLSALSRPEMSALTALLRARRSALMVAGPTPAPPPPPAPAPGGDVAGLASASVGNAPAPPAADSPGLVHLLPAPTRPSTSPGGGGSGSGASPTAVMITTGEAELALALLPYSRSVAPSRDPSQLVTATGDSREGAEPEAGALSTGVAAAAEDRGVGGDGAAGGEHDVWHEISAVSALDPVTGLPVLVVTQVDVSAKVRAERHLVHVMCAERRLLLQLFPRHVLQHVVEANPLLGPGGPGPGASPLESLPREWLDGGDWRPVLRDCDKLATMHPQATVLFADVAGFDDICMELPPQKVLAFLNDLFAKFDNSIEPFGVHKMETIGGLFIVAGGLLREEEDGAVAVRDRWDPLHAEKVFMFAKAMLNVAATTKLPTLEQQPVKLRIGIHTGPVMSGIVGTRVPRFVLFGDTVNTASRMQTTATPGSVHVSEDTRALLPHENWTPTGGVQIKGKGLLNTYVWIPEDQIHFLVPPAVSTPESTQAGGGGAAGGAGSGGASSGAAAAAAAAALNGGGSRVPPALLLSTQDTSCTSSDVFLAQQLSFTSALPPTISGVRGKSRLRHEGGYL